MEQLYRKIDPLNEGDSVQFVGMYVLRWQPEWGSPAIGFVEVDEKENELDKKRVDDPKPSLLELCESLFMLAINGDYSNGIEAFGVDEGRVRTGELLTKYESALKDCRIGIALGECCCGANR